MREGSGERMGVLAALLSSTLGGIAALPIGASVFATLAIGEPFGLNLALGVIAVLAGVAIATRAPRVAARPYPSQRDPRPR